MQLRSQVLVALRQRMEIARSTEPERRLTERGRLRGPSAENVTADEFQSKADLAAHLAGCAVSVVDAAPLLARAQSVIHGRRDGAHPERVRRDPGAGAHLPAAGAVGTARRLASAGRESGGRP